ncbi:MAG: amino acid permease [Pirellulaceae bacterium]
MTKPEKTAGAPRRQLSLLDTTCIIVGIIIGSGIYKTTPLIAMNVPGPSALLLVWIAGGLISLVGALCYAELATAFPREGGDYVYLTKAYGRRAGFVFAWCEFWIIRPGNVGMMAFVFAEYAKNLIVLNLGGVGQRYDEMVFACAALLVLTVLNLLGVRSGKWTQNLLTGVKVVGLLAIFAVALFWSPPQPAEASVARPPVNPDISLSTAMVLVLFTYGGWNDVSFVAAEVHNPRRNLLRALLLGLGVVTLIYVLVNLAFLRVLGIEGTANSSVPAADVLEQTLGEAGSRVMSALICVSALGAMNGMMFTGARIYFALGEEHRLYAWLGRWSARFDAPLRALSLQFLVTASLVILIGRDADGFTKLLVFSAPVFWAFIFLVAISLFVLRGKRPDTTNVYRVPLYPLTPIAFCASTAFLVYSSINYSIYYAREHGSWEYLLTAAIVALGVMMSLLDPNRGKVV